ncbi:MAG: redoxin domain-containing protein [Thermodesulfobacteriota bacterium]
MKKSIRFGIIWVMVVLMSAAGFGLCFAQPVSGKPAPPFSGKDIAGKTRQLSDLKTHSMVVLYFFDPESSSSREGLTSLDRITDRFGEELMVWGITRAEPDPVKRFVSDSGLDFPIILDRSDISDQYQARMILPTVYILGPELKIVDYFQGGGKHTEVMLVRLAERNLGRNNIQMARAITDQVAEKNPKSVEAKTMKAMAAVEEGNLDEAEKISEDLKQEKGEGEINGKEVEMVVLAKKGETEKAMQVAEELQKKAPDRPQAYTVKGNIKFAQDKKAEAIAEYKKAATKEEGSITQKAEARNIAGRALADAGDYSAARSLYEQAIDIDPYFIEATANKGVTYEKEGDWGKALDSYRGALALDKNDVFAAALAKQAQEMLALQQDGKKRERIDRLVKELAARFREQQKTMDKNADSWTSRPMILTFIDFQEKGGLPERDGYSSVMAIQLADRLNASGRVQVVERVLIERLLEELNLGSSDLADPETALELGRVLAAKLLGTGTLFFVPNGTLLNMRLIDTETSAIPKVVTRQISEQASMEQELNQLNRELLRTIIEKYPLRGYVVQNEGDQVLINLGSRQGVVLGTQFEVLGEGKTIVYKGKTLKGSPEPIARIEVVQVEPDFSYARIQKQDRKPKRDDKIQEKVEDSVALR